MATALVKTKTRVALLIGVVLALGGVTIVGANALTGSTAPINHFTASDEIVFQCTTTTNFATMPQMARTFTVGSPGSDQAVVMWSGSLSMGNGGGAFDTGFIRLTVDGTQQTPGEVPVIGVNDRGAHTFNFQTGTLAPGTHTARIQWRTDLGSNLCVDARSVIVLSK